MMTRSKLCIASTNPGKIVELNSLLGPYFEIYSLSDFGTIPEPEEPYRNFLENAIHKAKYYAQHVQMPTLSEDTGLEILSLNGFPGVFSKRVIEQQGGRLKAYHYLKELLDLKKDKRAQFRCVAVLYDPRTEAMFCGDGVMEGRIVFPPRGEYGFGYDSIFVPDGYEQSIAELGESVKRKIGHRGKAIRSLLESYSKQ